ncbi:hypothetical protein QBC35DRAFT_502763 [Podospora australis]|uniref:Uncharacterized protein n=1 Tax=Podospora australis TaxID=1536484 RepID=A0AAN7AES2_9PEZI|nr:hypothetical protein QBC35DRAFT_502763 [Podospora australis]
MQFTTALVALMATLTLAAPAPLSAPVDEVVAVEARQSAITVQLEIDFDTFIQRNVNVGNSLNANRNLIRATLVAGPSNARCQAFNGNTPIGAPIIRNQDTIFNYGRLVFVSHIRC